MAETKKRGLGRGLEALFPASQEVVGSGYAMIDLDRIKPNASQPRTKFDQEALQGLAESIAEIGVLQPVVVRAADDGFELVAGERRWRAARLAGLEAIPVVVRDPDDEGWHNLTEALVENVQREDLSVLDQAAAYSQLMEDFGWTHEEVGKRVFKSRSTITNAVRLLQLPAGIQGMVERGELSAGHAKALLGIEDQAYAEHIAKRAVADGWSVRMVEEAARARSGGSGKAKPKRKAKGGAARPAEIIALEQRLGEYLATDVKIDYRGKGGRVLLGFDSLSELERIYRAMLGSS